MVRAGTGGGPFAVFFGGVIELHFSGEYDFGDQWLIFDFDGYNDDFAPVTWTGLPPEQSAEFDPGTGTVQIIPEPATFCLLVLGALVVIRRRTP